MRGPYRTHSFIAFSLSLALVPACTEFEFQRTTAPEPTSPTATPSATPSATPTPIVTSTTTMPTPPPPTPIPTPTTPPPQVTPAEQLPPIFAEPVRTARA